MMTSMPLTENQIVAEGEPAYRWFAQGLTIFLILHRHDALVIQ